MSKTYQICKAYKQIYKMFPYISTEEALRRLAVLGATSVKIIKGHLDLGRGYYT